MTGRVADLLLLTHPDGIIFVGFLALCEGITEQQRVSVLVNSVNTRFFPSSYPWPPPALGAPVSPPAMILAVVVNERVAGRTALTID